LFCRECWLQFQKVDGALDSLRSEMQETFEMFLNLFHDRSENWSACRALYIILGLLHLEWVLCTFLDLRVIRHSNIRKLQCL
jgi:hypothetical protein